MLFGLPQRAGLFWLVTILAGTAMVVTAWSVTADPSFGLVVPAAVLAGAIALAEKVQVKLGSSRPGGEVLCSIGCTVMVAVILLFPLQWAVSIAVIGISIGCFVRGQRDLQKILFNAANMSLAAAAGTLVWNVGGHTRDLASPLSAPWAILAALVYFVVNTGLTTAMVSFVLELPMTLVWWRGHRTMLLANMALLAAGLPVAALWMNYPWLVAALGFVLFAVHRAMADRVKLQTQTLDSLFQLADILDARDKYTHGHSERVGYYAEQVAIHLGMASERAHLTFLAGRLHDIGKCAVNNEVLLKRGSLDDAERTHMRQHPEVGSAMLSHFSEFSEVASFVRGHHERWDGQGYPDKLRGVSIPLEARIIAVVDSYDAMTTTRPYRVAMPHPEAVRRLRAGAGRQWDPTVVNAFISWSESHEPRPAPLPAAVLAV